MIMTSRLIEKAGAFLPLDARYCGGATVSRRRPCFSGIMINHVFIVEVTPDVVQRAE